MSFRLQEMLPQLYMQSSSLPKFDTRSQCTNITTLCMCCATSMYSALSALELQKNWTASFKSSLRVLGTFGLTPQKVEKASELPKRLE